MVLLAAHWVAVFFFFVSWWAAGMMIDDEFKLRHFFGDYIFFNKELVKQLSFLFLGYICICE